MPKNFSYPELSAAALLEAAAAYGEGKQRDQAVKLLERVVREYPDSPSARAARERLDKDKR